MNLAKSLDVFNPSGVPRIHIIGCGSVGSTEAELLRRFGLTKFTLWDMDVVESKNIANQMFLSGDVGRPKVEALKDLLLDINPECKDDIVLKPNGWQGELVNGIVFLAVDDIEIRKDFVKANKYNKNLKAVFDVRTGLFDAQCWSADWDQMKDIENLEKSMDFSHDEAAAETPRSACGEVLGVAPTVRMICCLAVTNFFNYIKHGQIKRLIEAKPFHLDVDGTVTAM